MIIIITNPSRSINPFLNTPSRGIKNIDRRMGGEESLLSPEVFLSDFGVAAPLRRNAVESSVDGPAKSESPVDRSFIP